MLRYPVPTLLNYGQNFTDAEARVQKIPAVLSYLSTLHSSRDGDLVLLVDGYDVWFQLRPEVLLERYFEVNRKANARVTKRLGSKAVEKEAIEQKVIFSAQKKCFPRDEDDPACFAAPESTLPRDVYGPETDKAVSNEENPYIKFRPRFLNAGIVMGELGAVRKLFARAQERLEQEQLEGRRGGSSDQTTFSQIWGEQEFSREVLRERYLSTSQRIGRKIKAVFGMKAPSIISPHPTHKLMPSSATAGAGAASFEFGIGLDYESLLGHPTVFAEYDSEWLTYSDAASISKATQTLGITPQRVSSLPDDIARSLPPFWTQNPQEVSSFLPPITTPWSNTTSLLTNLWTATVPALIHHNAHMNDFKTQRTAAWPRIWFQAHARALLDANVLEPYRPFAVTRSTGMKGGSRETAWWGRENRKWDTHVAGVEKEKEWVGWEALCGGKSGLVGAEEEVFRDGKGAWRPPRWDY